jgi:hypothetical protein
MPSSCVRRFTSIFGIVVVTKQMSLKDRLERKKYIGVWKWESQLTARTISRLPRMLTRYMDRNRMNMENCNSGFSVSPRRRNFEIGVTFLASMLLKNWRKALVKI